MPTSADAIHLIEQSFHRYGIFWKNTGRVSDNWKFKIYQSSSSKLQLGVYNRKSILIRVEKEIFELNGVNKLAQCPSTDAEASSNFKQNQGVCYSVDDLIALERVLSTYFGIDAPPTAEERGLEFSRAIAASLSGNTEERRRRLATAEKMPRRISIQTTVFVRNPDVVAEALLRAAGKCEQCSNAAPFVRASNGEPYLEVHHRLPLARGGEDTIENAIAVCPNCHRRAHFA